MPNIASAKKRMRQDAVRRARNRSGRSNLRTQARKTREAIADKDVAKSESEFRLLTKKLDQAAARRLIHPNAAARLKSRFSHAIKAIKS